MLLHLLFQCCTSFNRSLASIGGGPLSEPGNWVTDDISAISIKFCFLLRRHENCQSICWQILLDLFCCFCPIDAQPCQCRDELYSWGCGKGDAVFKLNCLFTKSELERNNTAANVSTQFRVNNWFKARGDVSLLHIWRSTANLPFKHASDRGIRSKNAHLSCIPNCCWKKSHYSIVRMWPDQRVVLHLWLISVESISWNMKFMNIIMIFAISIRMQRAFLSIQQ